MNKKLFLVLSGNRVFGWKFNIYSSQLSASGNTRIWGIPIIGQEEERGAYPEEIELIRF